MQVEHGAMQDKDKSCNCLALGKRFERRLIFKKDKRLKNKNKNKKTAWTREIKQAQTPEILTLQNFRLSNAHNERRCAQSTICVEHFPCVVIHPRKEQVHAITISNSFMTVSLMFFNVFHGNFLLLLLEVLQLLVQVLRGDSSSA